MQSILYPSCILSFFVLIFQYILAGKNYMTENLSTDFFIIFQDTLPLGPEHP